MIIKLTFPNNIFWPNLQPVSWGRNLFFWQKYHNVKVKIDIWIGRLERDLSRTGWQKLWLVLNASLEYNARIVRRVRNAEKKVGNGRRGELQSTQLRRREGGGAQLAVTRVDILIVMNRPRYRGAIRAFRPPVFPPPPSLRSVLNLYRIPHADKIVRTEMDPSA